MKIFLFLLIVLSLFFPQNISAHSTVKIVEITADGFVPQEITIDENSSVIFLNKDKEAHWPASDPHPIHSIYPVFDPRRPILPGESWSFKPRVGVWKYHDHLFPHRRGVVTVVAEKGAKTVNVGANQDVGVSLAVKIKSVLSSIWAKIKNSPNFSRMPNPPMDIKKFVKLSSEDQMRVMKDMAENVGAKKTWEYIKKAFRGQIGSQGSIHDLAHLAGSLLYEKEGMKGLSSCTSNFAFGCYHGFLDYAFSKNLDNLSEAQNICMKLGPENSGPVASCIHGIGHGIASFHLVEDLKKSLSDCRKLTSGSEFCFDGVFMEFVRNAPKNFFKKDDPLYPCDELENEFAYAYSFSCGRNQPSLLMGRFNMGFDGVIAVCRSSSSTPFKQACFDALGFSLAATLDVNKIISGCLGIEEDEFVKRCINSAAGELVFQEVPGWEEKSRAVCNALATGQDECLQYVDRLASEYGRVKKVNFTPSQKNVGN